MRVNYYKFPENIGSDILEEYGLRDGEYTLDGISVSEVKKLIKNYGGVGYTMEHYLKQR